MTILGAIIAMGIILMLALIQYIRYKKEQRKIVISKDNPLEYDNDEYDYGHNVNHNETFIS